MKLVVNRGTVVPFASLPANSIALDGYVQGAFIDPAGNRYSFDHHGDCIRMVTSATCVQVLDAILMGLDVRSIEQVFVNDVDGDTALAFAMLESPWLVLDLEFASKVRLYGLIDAHGPAYPFHPEERRQLHQVDWAMTPCSSAHIGGTYATADLRDMLAACVQRIAAVLPGRQQDGSVHPLKAQCLADVSVRAAASRKAICVDHQGAGWALVRSEDGSTQDVYAAGHSAFIVYKQLSDGSFSYTVAKKSDLHRFPVKRVLETLHAVEPGWGGGSCIGGAPRNPDGSRSRIEPERLVKLIEAILNA